MADKRPTGTTVPYLAEAERLTVQIVDPTSLEELRMAARAYWPGRLRLVLVSIPIELYPATRTAGTIALNRAHEPIGKQIKYEMTVPGNGEVAS